jgi:hypothetical protein
VTLLRQPPLEGAGSQPTLVVFEAVLERGDVLLLPAHWLHYVEALTPLGSAHSAADDVSVSVNLWTPSKEELLLNQLMAPPQPWPDGVNAQAETLCVQLLLRTVLMDSAPALQRYLRAPFVTAAPSAESDRDTEPSAAAKSAPYPGVSSHDNAGESSSAGEPPASASSGDDSARPKAAKGRRARRQKQHKQQSERKGDHTTQSLPALAAAEAEQVVAAFLRQLLSHKGYDLEQQQQAGLPRPQPPACVSPAQVQSTVASSGMPKEWAEAIVQRAKVVAQVFLESAAANGAPGGGTERTAPSGAPLMQAETVAVHVESYLEVYAMNVVNTGGGAVGEWALAVGPFLRECVCGPACGRAPSTAL